MTVDVIPSSRRSLRSPEVNKGAVATMVPPNPTAAFLGYVTGSTSPSIREPADAWLRYLNEPGVSELHYEPMLVNTMVTGATDRPWHESAGLLDWNRVPNYAADIKRISGGAVGSLMSWLVEGAGSVNVNTGKAEDPPDVTVAGPLPVNTDPIVTYSRAAEHAEKTLEAATSDIRRRLDQKRATYIQRSPREVATELGDDLGVGQLVIARAIGVSPTAVRKWRRGEAARAEHRDELAKLAALMACLGEVGLHDPASWIDIPVSADSTLKPLDLFSNGRSDLLVLLGAGALDPQEALDEFESDWRKKFAPDSEYEVLRLSDGSRTVVPRRGGRF